MRCLLLFGSVCLQIPFDYGLQKILDHKAWKRRTRALVGLTIVAVPLMGAWIWEIVRVRNHDISKSPTKTMDWSNSGFVSIFFLYMLNWLASSLWQYVILYFLGCLTNSPRKSANYAGVFRGVLEAGEAICFGLDSIALPYIKGAGTIFVLYATGVIVFYYLAIWYINETEYFNGEDDVVIPKYVLDEHTAEAAGMDPESKSETSGGREDVKMGEKSADLE